MKAPWSINARKKARKYGFPTISEEIEYEIEGHHWNSFDNAIKHGHLKVVKYLTTIGYKIDQVACEEAASSGHLKILKWLHANVNADNIEDNLEPIDWCYSAIYHGHLKILKWAIFEYIPSIPSNPTYNLVTIVQNMWEYAVRHRKHSLKILKWLWSLELHTSIVLNELQCGCAATANTLKVLKWLRSIGTPWNKNVCLREAHSDKIRKWIYSQPA
jgi:hypothetical protein